MDRVHLHITLHNNATNAGGIQTYLDSLEGVTFAAVDLDGSCCVVEYDVDKIDLQDIVEEITRLGVSVTVT